MIKITLIIILTILKTTLYSLTTNLYTPSNIKTGVIICSSPFVGNPPGYTTPYPSSFPTQPILMIGINKMSMTPGLSIYFRIRIVSIQLVNFLVEITFGTSTSTFSIINMNFMAVSSTAYSTMSSIGVTVTPFYAVDQEWSNDAISSLGLNSGQRTWEMSFPRGTVQPAVDVFHLVICSTMLMGVQATTDDYEYALQNSCYCSNGLIQRPMGNALITGYCYYKATVKKTTRVKMLRVRLFVVDYLLLDLVHTHVADLWIQNYQNGMTSNLYPKNQPPLVNVSVFYGLNSLTIKDATPQTINIDYTAGTYSIPANYKASVHYIIIARGDCRSRQWLPTGDRVCYQNAYNGCALSSVVSMTMNRDPFDTKMSRSNKYMIMATQESLDIYKFVGSSYVVYQSIYIRGGCKAMAYNSDFSLIVIAKNTYSPNKFELFTFNTTSQFWQSRYRHPGDLSTSNNMIAISQNGQTIILTATSTLQHFEYNTTSQKYDLIDQKTINGSVIRMQLLTEPNGDIKLSMILSDGLRLTQSKKAYKSGRFRLRRQQKLLQGRNPLATKFAWTPDGKVLAVQYQTFGTIMAIYHYNSATESYQIHSQFKYDVVHNSSSISIDYQGLNIILHGRDYNGMYMVVYRRTSLTDQFKKIIVERTFPYISNMNIVYSDITKETIVVISSNSFTDTYLMKIYSCGVSVVVNVDPQSGDSLLGSIVQEPEIDQLELRFTNINNNLTQVKGNLTLMGLQNQNISSQVGSVEASLNLTQQNITNGFQNISTALQNVSASLLDKIQQLQQDKNENKNDNLIVALFIIIGVYTIVLVVLGYMVLKNRWDQAKANQKVNDSSNGSNIMHQQAEITGENIKTVDSFLDQTAIKRNDSSLKMYIEPINAQTKQIPGSQGQLMEQNENSIVSNQQQQFQISSSGSVSMQKQINPKKRKKRPKIMASLEQIDVISFDHIK